eukprot:Nk52_evm4s179 gene=Nk52_evmTU4s179
MKLQGAFSLSRLAVLLCLIANPMLTCAQTTLSTSSDVASCVCDLLGNNECDPNCCCDADCSTADKAVFSQCDDPGPKRDIRECYSSSVIVTSNTDLNTTETNDLFCVYTNNDESTKYYDIPADVTTASGYTTVISQTGAYLYSAAAGNQDISLTSYTYGSPLHASYTSASNTLGYFALPAPMVTNACSQLGAITFLDPQYTSCTQTTDSLATQCTSNTALDGKTYTEGFRVASTGTEDGATAASSGVTVTVSKLWCISSTTLTVADCGTTTISSPSISSGSCTNVVTKVEYSIIYNGATITAVYATLTFADFVTSSTTAIEQVFETSYKTVTNENTVVFERSGNPGYIVGKPVLAGTLASSGSTNAIDLDTDNSLWLTIAGPQPDGSCANANGGVTPRVPVYFGENTVVGCTLQKTFAQVSAASCATIRQDALTYLSASQQNSATYVGQYGNSSVNDISEWVAILDQSTPSAATDAASDGICPEIYTDLEIQILTARVGAILNPQTIITGVRYVWTTSRFVFQCAGPYCQTAGAALTQSIQLKTSVNFIDTSRPPISVKADVPDIFPAFPNDFFYPFFSAATPLVDSTPTLLLLSFLCSLQLFLMYL